VLLSETLERMRTLAASVDGSFLDDDTWRARHFYVLLTACALALYTLVFSIANPHGFDQWLCVAVEMLALPFAAIHRLPRRVQEALVAVSFVAGLIYATRYAGNLGLGPLALIVLTFYQDWVAIAVGLAATAALLVLAGVDPAFFSGSPDFARDPLGVMALRATAIALAAVLALAIWRSGTQLARDQLTGLLSRLGAERVLDREIAHGRRPAVWVCDVDNFSAVNRQLGPSTGDLLLRHVGNRLRRTARSRSAGSLCARLGGDTFLILDRSPCDAVSLETFAHRIEAETGASLHGVSGQDVPVRLSVGAAVAASGETAAHVIRAAERNMRDAKGRGTVRVVVDHGGDRIVDHESSLLSSELYAACERGELELHVQPIVALADGAPVGGETLVRWHHPRRGLLYPLEFLPEAEQDSALMAVISNSLGTVFHTIVAGFAERHGPDWLPYGLSYNLAAIRFRDPTLTASLVADYESTGMKGTTGRVNVEVTEGALMEIEHGVPEALGSFRDAGYRLALDDFGIGHSSLAHLRDFPLDTVKLDMSFVHSMGRSPIDRAVVQAVADIASASGLKVVAEGVETAEQRDMLLSIKPDMLAQGWLYARALPVDDFETWVLDRKSAAVA
jgi:diguanylate cyclase (GGDEF)-like protein